MLLGQVALRDGAAWAVQACEVLGEYRLFRGLHRFGAGWLGLFHGGAFVVPCWYGVALRCE